MKLLLGISNFLKQKQKILIKGGKNTQKNYTKKVPMTRIVTIMWSFT